mmetsp:Transcript_22449/g.23380  ORF Transcript_22449/g.23380 Transcript_22449/m.23380 type:complete len:259 (+) Transcript_22449:30-806(+)
MNDNEAVPLVELQSNEQNRGANRNRNVSAPRQSQQRDDNASESTNASRNSQGANDANDPNNQPPPQAGVMGRINNIQNFCNQTIALIVFLSVTLAYSILFIVLFVIFIEKDTSKFEDCHMLKSWDISMYIILGISTILSVISYVLQLNNNINNEDWPGAPILLTAVRCITGFATLVNFIGIQVVYFNIERGLCGKLGELNLAFIITTYVLLLTLIVLFYVLCCTLIHIAGEAAEEMQEHLQGGENNQEERNPEVRVYR